MKKIALVTGSTSGIGYATATKLLDSDIKVIFSSELEGFDIPKKYKENSTFIKCDISKKAEIEKLTTKIREEYGHLDYLVASAGIMPLPCGIDDITEENIEKTLQVNLIGTFWTLKLVGKLIQETSKHGSIVTLTSVDGIIGEPYGVIYSTTKAGIISLTKSFARHFKEPLVRVNSIAPGLIDTPLTASTGEEPSWTTDLSIIERMGRPEEIASSAYYLLSEESSFITGQVIAVDGGFTLK